MIVEIVVCFSGAVQLCRNDPLQCVSRQSDLEGFTTPSALHLHQDSNAGRLSRTGTIQRPQEHGKVHGNRSRKLPD